MALPSDPLAVVVPAPPPQPRRGQFTSLTAQRCSELEAALKQAEESCTAIEKLLTGPEWPKTAPLADIIAARRLARDATAALKDARCG